MTCTHHHDFLGRFLALHQHGPEVHAALDCKRKKRYQVERLSLGLHPIYEAIINVCSLSFITFQALQLCINLQKARLFVSDISEK